MSPLRKPIVARAASVDVPARMRRALSAALALAATLDASAGTTEVGVADASGSAGGDAPAIVFPVSVRGDLSHDVAVAYRTVDGSAVAGVDYVATSGVLAIGAGATHASIAVPLVPAAAGAGFRTRRFSLQLRRIEAPPRPLVFGATRAFAGPSVDPMSLAAVDLDLDGRVDLAVATLGGPPWLSQLRNTGAPDVALAPAPIADVDGPGLPPKTIALEVDGDGRPDLVTLDRDGFAIVLNTADDTGAPVFLPAFYPALAAADLPRRFAVADVDRDGRPDLVFLRQGDDATHGTLDVLLNRTVRGALAPQFGAVFHFAIASEAMQLAVADFDRDDAPDVAVFHDDGAISVLVNETPERADTPVFADPIPASGPSFPLAVAAADLDLDGKVDLVVLRASGGACLLANTTAAGGAVAFSAPAPLATGLKTTDAVAVADVDRDGRPDLLVGSTNDLSLSLLTNATTAGAPASFDAPAAIALGAATFDVLGADLDGDGAPDLVASTLSQTVAVRRGPLVDGVVVGAPATGTITDTVFASGFE